MRQILEKPGSVLVLVLVVYLIYVLVSGLLVFYITKPEPAKVQPLELKDTDERVVLIDGLEDSWQSRLDLIASARDSLDICYYSFHKGETVEDFCAAILAAADRGVEVRLLLDGLSNGLWLRPQLYQALASHPRIQLAYYEPLDLIRPWTWQNRLHDKMIIVDGKTILTGGRNIGDKYFFRNDRIKSTSIDRDVILFSRSDREVLIPALKAHFNHCWTSDLTKKQTAKRTDRLADYQDKIIARAKARNRVQPDLTSWESQALPIRQAAFVTNPLGRFYKEPVVWSAMLALMSQARESILVQSPYVVPVPQMVADLKAIPIQNGVEVTLLTNSQASSNNTFANAGYLNCRPHLLAKGVKIAEFQPHDAQFHTKAFIIDDRYAALGTFNLDSRSAYLNTESMLVFDSPELVQAVRQNLAEDYGSEIQSVDSNHPADSSHPSPAKRLLAQVFRPLAWFLAPFL